MSVLLVAKKRCRGGWDGRAPRAPEPRSRAARNTSAGFEPQHAMPMHRRGAGGAAAFRTVLGLGFVLGVRHAFGADTSLQ